MGRWGIRLEVSGECAGCQLANPRCGLHVDCGQSGWVSGSHVYDRRPSHEALKEGDPLGATRCAGWFFPGGAMGTRAGIGLVTHRCAEGALCRLRWTVQNVNGVERGLLSAEVVGDYSSCNGLPRQKPSGFPPLPGLVPAIFIRGTGPGSSHLLLTSILQAAVTGILPANLPAVIHVSSRLPALPGLVYRWTGTYGYPVIQSSHLDTLRFPVSSGNQHRTRARQSREKGPHSYLTLRFTLLHPSCLPELTHLILPHLTSPRSVQSETRPPIMSLEVIYITRHGVSFASLF